MHVGTHGPPPTHGVDSRDAPSPNATRTHRLRVIVTGCGRSGTTYASDVLSAAGLRCRHERIFTVLGPQWKPALDGDSSWYAAPFLEALDEDVKIVHLVRNPRHVVRSFHRIGMCAIDPWHHFTFGRPLAYIALRYNVRWRRYRRRWRFVMAHRYLLWAHTTCMSDANEVDRLWAYWRQWNALVEQAAAGGRRPYLRIRLEDLDASLPRLRDFLELRTDLQPLPAANKKLGYRVRPIEWTPMPAEVRSLARRYGYEDEELEG